MLSRSLQRNRSGFWLEKLQIHAKEEVKLRRYTGAGRRRGFVMVSIPLRLLIRGMFEIKMKVDFLTISDGDISEIITLELILSWERGELELQTGLLT